MPDFETPEWVHNAVFYQIFPDRFASSNTVPKPHNLEAWDTPPTLRGFKGGDLVGVMDRLDYLQDLGITALYLNPIFQSTANHRYHTHNYFQVDPLLGGNNAFQGLIKEAHRRNIRIILDGVFNHTGRGFYQFNHILENGPNSPFLDWFQVKGYPLNAYNGRPNYACWQDLAELPEVDFTNSNVRTFIYDVASYWLNQGIDGWRLDAPFCIDDDDFWQEFRYIVKSINKDAYIVGEIGEEASRWLQGTQFDAVMNYEFAYTCWGFFGGDNLDRNLLGHWLNPAKRYLHTDVVNFTEQIEALLSAYPRQAVLSQLNLLCSHDTSRLLTILGNSTEKMRLATLFQMTYPGAPCIFYGDEIGITGSLDPECRRSFPWNEHSWDQNLRSFFKRCIHLRHAHPALRDGEFHILYAQDELVVYLRKSSQDQVVIAINCSKNTFHLDIPVNGLLQNNLVLINQLGPGDAHVIQGRLSGITLPPENGVLLL